SRPEESIEMLLGTDRFGSWGGSGASQSSLINLEAAPVHLPMVLAEQQRQGGQGVLLERRHRDDITAPSQARQAEGVQRPPSSRSDQGDERTTAHRGAMPHPLGQEADEAQGRLPRPGRGQAKGAAVPPGTRTGVGEDQDQWLGTKRELGGLVWA